MGTPIRVTMQSTSSKCKCVEEPLSEFQKPDSSESEDSEDKGLDSNSSEDDNSESEDSESKDSESEVSDNNRSEDDDSKSSGSDNSNDSTTSESDEEDSTGSSTDAISLFLEDNFDEQLPLSRRTAKKKFKQILSDADDDEEMSIDPSLEGLTPFDVYQPSDDDENMIIEEPEAPEEPDDTISPNDSSNNPNDTGSESSTDSQESYKSINFAPPEIDSEIFDQPFNSDDYSIYWIIL